MIYRISMLAALTVFVIDHTQSRAGERGPGRYTGTVVFDRWDACMLYSGISVMYVSESIKEELRSLAGECVTIDADDVYQPRNPGDGLIKSLRVLGPAEKDTRSWVRTDGLRITSSVGPDDDGHPVVSIQIRNATHEAIEILSDEITPTLLTRSKPETWTPHDGPSMAIVTRISFQIGQGDPRWKGRYWTIGKENALPDRFTLEPGKQKTIQMRFDLPEGEYDFLCGYGGKGAYGLASQLVAFDVEDKRYVSVSRRASALADLGSRDDREAIGPISAQLVWQRSSRQDSPNLRALAVAIHNRSGHQLQVQMEPEDLQLNLCDPSGNPIEEMAQMRSGPIPTKHVASLAADCIAHLSTHRGGLGVSAKDSTVVAAWQAWQLPPGTYLIRGTLRVQVAHESAVTDPLLPSRSTHADWFGKSDEFRWTDIPLRAVRLTID